MFDKLRRLEVSPRSFVSAVARRFGPSDTTVSDRRAVFVLAFLVFALMTVLAWIRLPESDNQINWTLVVLLVLAGTPANLVVTSYEFRVMGGLLGVPITMTEAVRVSVFSSAANLLPLPGSVLVRGAVLRKGGAAYKDIGIAVVTMAIGLLAVTGIACGLVLIIVGHFFLLGGALEAGGVMSGALLVALTRGSRTDQVLPPALHVILAEMLLIVVVASRIFVALPAIGYGVSVSQTAALAAAGVAATATGIFPAGLGIRELASGVAAKLVELPIEVGVIAAAIDRVAFAVGLLPIFGRLAWSRHSRPTPTGIPSD